MRQIIQTLPFLILTIFNICVCKNYTPKVQYWQFCPTLSKQSLADFCRSKNKNKTKMFGNFFSLGFWKIIMTPLPAHLSWGDPFWCKTLDSVVEQSSGIDFMLETLRRKFILVSSTFNKYACAQMVYNFGCSKILQRRPMEAVFIILQKKIFITRNH